MIHCEFTLASFLSFPKSSQYSSFWASYMMRFFPGWPSHQSLGEYCFSMLLVFLLAFTVEFCSNIDPINIKRRSHRLKIKGLLLDAALHGLRMFMAYLLIISVITTDFMFLLAALTGHTAGNFITTLFEHHIEQTMTAPAPINTSCPATEV
ncbi:hypothetical protein ACH5RR_004919 [Cinchona calisaya]|uniref:Copper transporter n=1 Tax=Cinchona calisaya TaxID=153742 RepID=A0ABD3AZB8_9GENT